MKPATAPQTAGPSQEPTAGLQAMTAAATGLAVLCAFLWGGLAVAIRFTQDDLPPLGTAALRFGMASVLLVLWAWGRGHCLRPISGERGSILSTGLLLAAQIGLFHWGLNHTNSAHASVLIGSHPVFVVLIAHFLLPGDRLSARKLCGLILAVGGLLAVVWGEQFRSAPETAARDIATLLGDGIIAASSLLLGIKMVYMKHALRSTDATRLLVWSFAVATLLFSIYSLLFEGPDRYRFTSAATLGLLYQGLVVSGFCFAAWAYLLSRHRASQLAVFSFVQPLAGMLFGVWLRGDFLTAWLLSGGLAVAIGIFLVTRASTPGPPATLPDPNVTDV